MTAGVRRSDVEYVWPLLLLPPPEITVVYLDLNHWIGLAKASTGHRDAGQYLDLLEAARARRADGSVTFVLSGQHYMEMSLIRDPRQRRDLAVVMEELSGFTTLLCRSVVMRFEFEAALDAATGTQTTAFVPLPVLGNGFGHAFGIQGKAEIRHKDGLPVDVIRRSWPGGPQAYNATLAEMQLYAERQMLAGPKDDDLDALTANGFVPYAARIGQEKRAQQEREQATRFDDFPNWRKGRIRDVVSTRYMIVELLDMTTESLARRGLKLEDVWFDVDSARGLVDSMPSGDVHVSLQTAAHRNPQTTWKPNDYFDIDALSLAVPYCDIVLTERHRCHVLRTEGCAQRLDTVVIASPDELIALLHRVPDALRLGSMVVGRPDLRPRSGQWGRTGPSEGTRTPHGPAGDDRFAPSATRDSP